MKLRGVNLDGWLVAGAEARWRGFVGEGDVARLASWRFSHVRLPVDASLLFDGSEVWRALDSAVQWCGRYGLGCMVALRVAPDQQRPLFERPERWAALAAQWQALARRYGQAPAAMLYDLLELPAAPDDLPPDALDALGAPRLSAAAASRPAPAGATAARAWGALALKLTRAIRAVDSRSTIAVQVNGGNAAGFAQLRPTRDGNTAYGFRCFDPPAFTMQEAPPGGAGAVSYPGVIDGERWDRARLEALLQPVVEFRRTFQMPAYLSAFGVSALTPRSGQLTWTRTVLSLCRAYDLDWAYWTYKSAPGIPCGLVAGEEGVAALPAYQNGQRLDYELLGVLQSEAS